MANPFVHVELATTDLDKAKSFYGSLFSWQLEDVDMGSGMSYTMVGVGEGTGGGMMKHPVPGRRRLGSHMCLSTMSGRQQRRQSLSALRSCAMSPRSRTMARCRYCRPDGATLGLWQPKKK